MKRPRIPVLQAAAPPPRVNPNPAAPPLLDVLQECMTAVKRQAAVLALEAEGMALLALAKGKQRDNLKRLLPLLLRLTSQIKSSL